MYILHFTPHHPSPHHHHQNPDNDHHHLLDEYDTEDNQNNCSYCLQEQVSTSAEQRARGPKRLSISTSRKHRNIAKQSAIVGQVPPSAIPSLVLLFFPTADFIKDKKYENI